MADTPLDGGSSDGAVVAAAAASASPTISAFTPAAANEAASAEDAATVAPSSAVAQGAGAAVSADGGEAAEPQQRPQSQAEDEQPEQQQQQQQQTGLVVQVDGSRNSHGSSMGDGGSGANSAVPLTGDDDGGSSVDGTTSPVGSLTPSVSSAALPVFSKTLHSDVDAARSLALLKKAWSIDPMLSAVFGPADSTSTGSGARELAAVLSVLHFAPGERIIRAGEEASFAALVLEGCVAALVGPGVTVPLPAGSWVGEMSFFERGPRSADIEVVDPSGSGNSSSGAGSNGSGPHGAMLAVLSYEDLERLNDAGQHELAHKLTVLMAMASIKKLRKMTAAPTTASPTTSASTPSVPPPSMGRHGSIVGGHAAALLSSRGSIIGAGVKQESMFAARLAKQTAALAEVESRARAELASMKILVHRREAEMTYAKENGKNKLQKVETELREAGTRIAELNKRVATEKKKRAEAEQALAKLQTERGEALAAHIAADVRAKDAEERASLAEEAARLASVEAQALVVSAQSEMDRMARELEEQKSLLAAALADKVDVGAIEAAHKAELTRVEGERNGFAEQVQTLSHEKAYHDFRYASLVERLEAAEAEGAAWRRRSADYLESYEKLLLKYRNDLTSLQASRSHSARTHDALKKLVRSLSLRAFVRNWVLRRRIFNIHLQVSEMVLQRWEDDEAEQRSVNGNGSGGGGGGGSLAHSRHTTTGLGAAAHAGESSLYVQLQSERAKAKQPRLHQQQQQSQGGSNLTKESGSALSASLALLDATASSFPGSQSSTDVTVASTVPYSLLPPYALSGPAHALAWPEPRALSTAQAYTAEGDVQHVARHTLRMEKKKYLQSLRAARDPPPSIYSLLQSVSDELVELRTPLDALSLRSRALRATLDSFFQRNIQLTSRCLSTQKALEVTLANYQALKASMQARHAAEQEHSPFGTSTSSSNNNNSSNNGNGNGNNNGQHHIREAQMQAQAQAAAAAMAAAHAQSQQQQQGMNGRSVLARAHTISNPGHSLQHDEKEEGRAGTPISARTPHPQQYHPSRPAGSFSGTLSSLSPPPTASSGARPGSSHGARPGSSHGNGNGGGNAGAPFDWASLEQERPSSGYGITAPRPSPPKGREGTANHNKQQQQQQQFQPSAAALLGPRPPAVPSPQAQQQQQPAMSARRPSANARSNSVPVAAMQTAPQQQQQQPALFLPKM
jgi:hypothetical protein